MHLIRRNKPVLLLATIPLSIRFDLARLGGMHVCLPGRLCASFSCINALDELSPALSLAIRSDGARIAAGRKGTLHVFDTQRPGRDHVHQLDISPSDSAAQNGNGGGGNRGQSHFQSHKRSLIRSVAYAPAHGDCNGKGIETRPAFHRIAWYNCHRRCSASPQACSLRAHTPTRLPFSLPTSP